jgi:hypothetical protein
VVVGVGRGGGGGLWATVFVDYKQNNNKTITESKGKTLTKQTFGSHNYYNTVF